MSYTTEITTTPAWTKLVEAVERDEKGRSGFHDYRAKLEWIHARCQHYAERTGIPAKTILAGWEEKRGYWYMNFYQDANQPLLDEKVRIFPTQQALRDSVGAHGFRCPNCRGVSKDPQVCNSGVVLGRLERPSAVCDWKAFGLFGTLGKGVDILILETEDGSGMRQGNIFMPVAWEQTEQVSLTNPATGAPA